MAEGQYGRRTVRWRDVGHTRRRVMRSEDSCQVVSWLLVMSVELTCSTEKTVVHEWAHLKWGLFDEYAVTDDDQKFVMQRRRLVPNRSVPQSSLVLNCLCV